MTNRGMLVLIITFGWLAGKGPLSQFEYRPEFIELEHRGHYQAN